MSTAESKQPSVFKLLKDFGESSVGAKMIMAGTGVVVWGFVLGHMAGNLQIFLPGDFDGQAINQYAHTLKTTPPLLWGTRIVVGLSLLVHIATGMRLAAMNRAARPKRYMLETRTKTSLWGRWMPYTGLIVLVFIVVHLFHFTVPVGWAEFQDFRDVEGNHDVYRMVREGFSTALMAGFYTIGQLCLFGHLIHGSVSFLQSLGVRHKRWSPLFEKVALTVVAAILFGNLGIVGYIFLTYGISK